MNANLEKWPVNLLHAGAFGIKYFSNGKVFEFWDRIKKGGM